MIEINASVIAAHPLMSRLVSPPTHARLVERMIRLGQNDDMIRVVYWYGTLDASGAFVADQHVDPVNALVDLSDYSHLVAEVGNGWATWSTEKYAAAANLRNRGVVPHPSCPINAIATPAKVQDDFKICDLDAYFAFFDDRLNGAVIADPVPQVVDAPAAPASS